MAKLRFIFFLLALFIFHSFAYGFEIKRDHVKIRLVVESASSFSGPVRLGVHYVMDPDWHIYWKNPGDSGAAPKFEIDGGRIEGVHWPYPERIPITDLTNFGYNDESVVFLDTVLESRSPKINLEWLVCKVDCVPGFATIEINPSTTHIESQLFTKFWQRVPLATKAWEAQFVSEDHQTFSFKLQSSQSDLPTTFSHIFVFPEDGVRYRTQAPDFTFDDKGVIVKVPKSANAAKANSVQRFTVVGHRPNSEVMAFPVAVTSEPTSGALLFHLFLAFVGGLILNVMPCVLPVLFLKGFSFLKSDNPQAIRRSSWLYTLGVLASFLLIGAVILILRQAGQAVGWGFQLQNPYIVGFLGSLFVIMGLVFLDVLPVTKWIPLRLQNLGQKGFASTDFGTGVLAVVVASPCTAPFMGAALGYTLLLAPVESLLIFLFLGLGLALPVPILAHWPWLINKLPRSGPWMDKLKKLLAIPLFATAVWLFWVLGQQVSGDEENSREVAWQPYGVEMEKRPMFVDYTAAWCITCQVNKKRVLDTPEVQKIFRQNNVHLVRADWTNYDQEITESLAQLGRNSVPVYAYYPRGAYVPVLLPELLTKTDIKQLFLTGENQ